MGPNEKQIQKQTVERRNDTNGRLTKWRRANTQTSSFVARHAVSRSGKARHTLHALTEYFQGMSGAPGSGLLGLDPSEATLLIATLPKLRRAAWVGPTTRGLPTSLLRFGSRHCVLHAMRAETVLVARAVANGSLHVDGLARRSEERVDARPDDDQVQQAADLFVSRGGEERSPTVRTISRRDAPCEPWLCENASAI